MKTPKFLICDNPLADKAAGLLYILHTREPLVLAAVHEFEPDDEEGQMEAKRYYNTKGTLNLADRYVVLGAIWVVPGDKLATKEPQDQADKIAKTMRLMADWYEAYLNWENEND